LNIHGTFTGAIRNRGSIGKTGEELAQKWKLDHPGDPVSD
jgi:hypothetical protein